MLFVQVPWDGKVDEKLRISVGRESAVAQLLSCGEYLAPIVFWQGAPRRERDLRDKREEDLRERSGRRRSRHRSLQSFPLSCSLFRDIAEQRHLIHFHQHVTLATLFIFTVTFH